MAVAVGCGITSTVCRNEASPSAMVPTHKADHQNENDDGHLIFALIARQIGNSSLPIRLGNILSYATEPSGPAGHHPHHQRADAGKGWPLKTSRRFATDDTLVARKMREQQLARCVLQDIRSWCKNSVFGCGALATYMPPWLGGQLLFISQKRFQ